uniref:Ig-like domain-containing protein n=1 Tax=Periophthalmus magnuspinnatus TaxID=409849 RepID=A0A3B4AUD2_9GOBI
MEIDPKVTFFLLVTRCVSEKEGWWSPFFVSVGVLNGLEILHCDSEIRRTEPKQEWMKRVTEDDPNFWYWTTRLCVDSVQTGKENIEKVKRRFNQTEAPVTCHATGFYPDTARLFWTKDGHEVLEDVDPGEILPNGDGTFQTSVSLDLSSVPSKDWDRHHCVFQLFGDENKHVTRLDQSQIRTNGERGLVVGLIIIIIIAAAVALFVIRRKRGQTGQCYLYDKYDHI